MFPRAQACVNEAVEKSSYCKCWGPEVTWGIRIPGFPTCGIPPVMENLGFAAGPEVGMGHWPDPGMWLLPCTGLSLLAALAWLCVRRLSLT